MEVEIKLWLPDAAAHRRLSSFLAPRLLRTDATARPLAAATAAQRVRLYGTDDRDPSRAVLTLKLRPRIDAGVSRVEEVVEPLDPALALACVDNPARLGAVDSTTRSSVADHATIIFLLPRFRAATHDRRVARAPGTPSATSPPGCPLTGLSSRPPRPWLTQCVFRISGKICREERVHVLPLFPYGCKHP